MVKLGESMEQGVVMPRSAVPETRSMKRDQATRFESWLKHRDCCCAHISAATQLYCFPAESALQHKKEGYPP